MSRSLFIDVDGVVADFDTLAEQVFKMPRRTAEKVFGMERFWANLQSYPGGFYRQLPLLPDARLLVRALKQYNTTFLTGLPRGGWAESQKLAWRDEHFPDMPMICCSSPEKKNYMKPGDILVDDWPRYRDLWENAGGVFILHTSAVDSIERVKAIYAADENIAIDCKYLLTNAFARRTLISGRNNNPTEWA